MHMSAMGSRPVHQCSAELQTTASGSGAGLPRWRRTPYGTARWVNPGYHTKLVERWGASTSALS